MCFCGLFKSDVDKKFETLSDKFGCNEGQRKFIKPIYEALIKQYRKAGRSDEEGFITFIEFLNGNYIRLEKDLGIDFEKLCEIHNPVLNEPNNHCNIYARLVILNCIFSQRNYFD